VGIDYAAVVPNEWPGTGSYIQANVDERCCAIRGVLRLRDAKQTENQNACDKHNMTTHDSHVSISLIL